MRRKRKYASNVIRFGRRRKRKARKPGQRKPTFFQRLGGPLGIRLNAIAYTALVLVAFHFQGDVKVAISNSDTFSGRVIRIVDGDTIHVRGAGAPIRLWGVDAPERDTPRGPAATQMLRRIAYGQYVECFTMAHDRYHRIVARCQMQDGADISMLMIDSGTAGEYFHYTGGYYTRRLIMAREPRS